MFGLLIGGVCIYLFRQFERSLEIFLYAFFLFIISMLAIAVSYFQIGKFFYIETVYPVLFILLAMWGYKISAWWLVLGYFLHAIADVAALFLFQSTPFPSGFIPFCVSLNLLFASYLYYWAAAETRHQRELARRLARQQV